MERRVGETLVPVSLSEWQGRSVSRTVFKALLSYPARQARRDALLVLLWPDDDPQQVGSLVNKAVASMRHIFGSAFLEHGARSNLYQLASQEHIWVDVDAAQQLLASAEQRGRTSAQALPLLEEVVQLLGRGLYAEEEDGQWLSDRRNSVQETMYNARRWLAEAYAQQGLIGQAEIQWRAMLTDDPTDEDILSLALTHLHQQGLTSKALRLFKQVEQRLADEGATLSPSIHILVKHLRMEVTTENRQEERLFFLTRSQDVQNIVQEKSLLSKQSPHKEVRSSPPLVAPLFSDQLSALEEPLHMSKETLYLFSTLTETCRNLSEGNELRVAEQVLWAYLPKIEHLAQFSSQYQTSAAGIASQGYLLAASLVGHRNDLFRRLRYSERALRYAEGARDLNLQLVAIRQTAISFDTMDRPDKVLEVSQSALPYLEQISPLLQACIYAGMSGAYAEVGQEQDCLRSMELAYERFPEHPEREPRYLHTICRYSTLVFFDGLNQLTLGKPREAEKILARIDGLQPKMPLPERVRIELLNYQIKVFLVLKEREQASTYLKEAANAAFSIGSERHFQEAFSLFRQMHKMWREDPHIRQLADLFIR